MASIDNKVVSITFDNASFEKNVAQTMKTLAGLKASLDMKGAASGLQDISNAASKFSLAGIGSAVDNISSKFSAMGAVAFSVINNITSRAVDAGLSLAKSFTIDPIISGFAEFELKMGSIQTIMSGSGEPLEVVNQKLQELNTYSDKTIYSFKDMTSNIGKFTNAGLSLDQSVASIQGIANVAAISGANSEEASRAMYNFAQSLSAGSVKLMDWKSIENANMATASFKTELLESAVAAGTLTKDADGLYKTLEGTPVTATKGFNESLTEQWLTTEALNATLARYADETTEIGAKATAAATDVKTFSQMMDTLKEAAGSGWATTSELIFGDFEEGKKLWTGINDQIGGMISASAEARNGVLQIWKDGGGRALMIKSLGEAISNLGKILTPIKEAFRNVFPATTGRDLLTMTVRFSEFVKKLEPSEKTVKNLKTAFQGFFDGIAIGIHIIKGVAGLIGKILGAFGGASDGKILAVAAKIGEFVTSIKMVLVNGGALDDFFGDLGDTIVGFIKKVDFGPVISGIKDFISSLDFGPAIDRVKSAFEKLDFTGLTVAIDAIKSAFKGLFGGKDSAAAKTATESVSLLSTVLSGLASVAQSVINAIGKLFTGIGTIGSAIGGFLGDVQNELANLWNSLTSSLGEGPDLDQIFQGLALALGGGFVALLAKFAKNGFKLDFGQFKLMDELKDSLSAVTGSLKAMQTNIKADTLLKIAMAMGVLALAMLGLSFVNGEDLGKSLAAMAGGMAALVSTMVALEAITTSATGAAKLVLLAVAIGLLAGAVLLLGISAKLLGSMSWSELATGLTGVIGLLLGMAAATQLIAANTDGLIKAGFSMILIAGAMVILALAVKIMGSMDLVTIGTGMGAIAAGLIVISTAMAKMPEKGVIRAAIGIGVLGLSLIVLAGGLKVMAMLNLEEIGKGLGVLAVMMGGLVLAMEKLGDKKVFAAGGAMLLVGLALVAVAKALTDVSKISWGDLAKGLITFGGILLLIAIAMKGVKASLGGAVALFVVAQSLDALAGVLQKVGTLPIAVIVQGLIVLGAAIAGLAIITNILTPLIPIMAGFGVALFLVGAGAALFGAGVYLIARAVQILATAGKAGVEVFISVLDDLLLQLPAVAIAFGEAAFLFVTSFLSGFDTLIPMIVELIGTLLGAITELVPQFIETAVVVITAFLEGVRQVYPELIETAISMLLAFLTGIRDNIGEVVTLALQIMEEFILAIAGQVDNLAAAAVTLIVAWLGAVAGMLSDIIAAGVKLLVDFISGIVQNISDIADAATDLVVEFVASIGRNYLKVVTAGTDLIVDLITGLGNAASRVVTAGVDTIIAFIEGVGKNAVRLATAAADVIIDFVNGIATAINDKAPELREAGGRLGMAIADGMTFGLASKAGDVISKVGGVASSAINGAKSILGINSPSKVFWAIGEGIVEGLAIGISKDAPAQKSTNKLVSGVVDTFKESLKGIPDAIADMSELNPTITPVLDLTNVRKGANSLNSLLDTRANYSKALNLSTDLESQRDETTSTQYAGPTEIKYEQNNYSPKALSTNDIYRQTRSQIAIVKQELNIP